VNSLTKSVFCGIIDLRRNIIIFLFYAKACAFLSFDKNVTPFLYASLCKRYYEKLRRGMEQTFFVRGFMPRTFCMRCFISPKEHGVLK